MRVEEMIGQRIRARREELGLSQAQLGRYMGDLLGRDWPRQAVSAAEHGARAFTAAELVAFAFSLQTSVSGLLTPRADVTDVQIGDGKLPRDIVIASVLPRLAGVTIGKAFDDMTETVRQVGQHVIDARRALGPLDEDVLRLYREVQRAYEAMSWGGQAAAEESP